MRKTGFPAEWIRWVKCSITFHSFSVLVNRHPEGEWIKPQKGARLGCPLAPLLFVLSVDALAICTTQACFHERLRGFHTISYLAGIPCFQYADYTTFSMEGSGEEAKNLSALVDLFVDVSGLKINRGLFWTVLGRRGALLPSTWDKDHGATDEISQPAVHGHSVAPFSSDMSHLGEFVSTQP